MKTNRMISLAGLLAVIAFLPFFAVRSQSQAPVPSASFQIFGNSGGAGTSFSVVAGRDVKFDVKKHPNGDGILEYEVAYFHLKHGNLTNGTIHKDSIAFSGNDVGAAGEGLWSGPGNHGTVRLSKEPVIVSIRSYGSGGLYGKGRTDFTVTKKSDGSPVLTTHAKTPEPKDPTSNVWYDVTRPIETPEN